MTPQEELAVIRPNACQYKGVPVDLPEPVAQYIEGLIADRHSAYQSMDAIHAKYIDSLDLPAPPPSRWVPVEGLRR